MKTKLICLLAALSVLVLVPAAQAAEGGADPSTPTAAADAGKRPVLLVAGTLMPKPVMSVLATRLRAAGYTVSSMALPGIGRGDMAESAEGVGPAVDELRKRTGAVEVDVVGHSQGGLANRYYLKYLGGADKVHTYVSLGTPQHGISGATASPIVKQTLCTLASVVCKQLPVGSPFFEKLNAGGDTTPGVDYYSIWSSSDTYAMPHTSSRFDGPGGQTIRVQDYCPASTVGHIQLIFDRAVYGLVESALRGGPIQTAC